MTTSRSSSSAVSAAAIGETLAALRGRTPLVQCLTNVVVTQWTANVLLAVGAAPAMVDNVHEAGPFAGIAGAVLINLGTPYDDTSAAMTAAVQSAGSHGTPWVLDPVAAGALAWRTTLAHDLLAVSPPAVIRGNASEILALAGGAGGRGVDAVDTPESAIQIAAQLALASSTVVAVSGAVDHLTDGSRLVRIGNGHPWLTLVTGAGCALGAMMAACTAAVDDRLLAASAATAMLTVAADEAAQRAAGPGSFAVELLDQLAALTPQSLAERVKLI
jgi:hydroxyethylthiazole kinase